MEQDSLKSVPDAASVDAPAPRFKEILREEWSSRRGQGKGAIKGTFRQQIAMAKSQRVSDFWQLTFEMIRRARGQGRHPTRIETFDEACLRLRLTHEDLAAQFKQFRLAHWLCYGLGTSIMVYAYWLSLNSGWIPATGAFLFSVGALVNGYLYGFRAWQIQIRELAPLTDAVRRIDSYLVV